MPRGCEVRHNHWKGEVTDIFDNGTFSVIWGRYFTSPEKRLGIRWNGGVGEVGYPTARGGIPCWFVVPEELSVVVLLKLLNLDGCNKDNAKKALSEIL